MLELVQELLTFVSFRASNDSQSAQKAAITVDGDKLLQAIRWKLYSGSWTDSIAEQHGPTREMYQFIEKGYRNVPYKKVRIMALDFYKALFKNDKVSYKKIDFPEDFDEFIKSNIDTKMVSFEAFYADYNQIRQALNDRNILKFQEYIQSSTVEQLQREHDAKEFKVQAYDEWKQYKNEQEALQKQKKLEELKARRRRNPTQERLDRETKDMLRMLHQTTEPVFIRSPKSPEKAKKKKKKKYNNKQKKVPIAELSESEESQEEEDLEMLALRKTMETLEADEERRQEKLARRNHALFMKRYDELFHSDDTHRNMTEKEEGQGSSSLKDEDKECCICQEEDADTVLLPCQHYQFCFGCAERIINHNRQCPLCRQHIDSYTRF